MRVLLVHQLYQQRGGAARVLFGIEESLASHGHDVAVFTSSTERDEQRGTSSFYAVDGFDNQQFRQSASWSKLRWAARGIYSIPARLALRRAVAEFRPDVACVLKPEYQLSPSVSAELRALGVPVLQWLVDYKPWCTGGLFYNRELSEVCTRCVTGSHIHAAWYRCDRGSRSLSVYGALARTVTSTLLRLPWSASWYVVPTGATRRFLVETVGLPAARIDVIPHPMDVSRFEPRAGDADGPILFFGGLDSHKGLWTLVRALALLPGQRLYVAGVDGAGLLEAFHRDLVEAGVADRVTVDTELRMGPELRDKIRQARCIVAPSEWVDTLEYTLLESMSMGKAVLVGDRGGNASFVTHGEDGLVFEAGNPEALAEAISDAVASPARLRSIGQRARETVVRRLGRESFYSSLMQALQRAVDQGNCSLISDK